MAILVAEGPDAGLPWHFGNPVTEARALEGGAGIVDLRNRDIVEIIGADRLTWLHAITSQHLEKLAADEATTALILSPTGHIEQVLYGTDDGESFLAWTEPGHGAGLVAYLDSMRFAARVEVRLRDDLKLAWAGHGVSLDPQWRRRDSDLGGVEVFLPGEAELPANVGSWAFEAMRIAAGVPRIFIDTDHKTLPNEIGLVGTHLQKGCYRGQETVARVHNLGRPPRRLVQLHLDGSKSQLPEAGAELTLDQQVVGFVGSAARHHELGPVALGLIKRGVGVDATLDVGGQAASQEILVDPDIGLHIRPRLG